MTEKKRRNKEAALEKRKVFRIIAAVLAWVVTVAWGCFIYSMSAEDSVQSGKTSGKVVESVAGVVIPNYNKLPENEKNEVKSKLSLPIRKLAHFSEFAVLGALIMTSVRLTFDRKFMIAYYISSSAVLGILYAILDELHQASVPGRAPRVADVLIDSGGVICGVALVTLIILLIERKRRLIT